MLRILVYAVCTHTVNGHMLRPLQHDAHWLADVLKCCHSHITLTVYQSVSL